MNEYTGLAARYDALTQDVDYAAWLDWYRSRFAASGQPVETVLDLACGTGTLTCLLARAGYRVTGADASADMLTQAMDKAQELGLEPPPLLICQPMEALELPEPVDACVCSLDSLNYITGRENLERALRAVSRALRPGGLFLFDVIPPEEFARRDGQIYVDEDEETLCLWRADYDADGGRMTYGLDLFCRQPDGRWSREQEEHCECAWPLELLGALLEKCGFTGVRVYGADRSAPPAEADERVFFVCRRASA